MVPILDGLRSLAPCSRTLKELERRVTKGQHLRFYDNPEPQVHVVITPTCRY